MRRPRVGVGRELEDVPRQVPADDLVERQMLEHLAKARAHRDPYGLEVLGGPLVSGGLRAKAANFGERAVEDPEHLGKGDLARRAREAVPTLVAPLARHQPAAAHLGEDGPQESGGQALGLGDLLGGLGRPGRRQAQERAQPVVHLGGDVHPPILRHGAVELEARPETVARDTGYSLTLPTISHVSETQDPMVDAVLTASRVLVAVAARSLANLDDAEDVTLTQFRSLVVLASRGPQGMASLAEALGVTPPTATRLCDRLVRKGLVRRRADRNDRRQVRVALTDPGKKLVDIVTQRRRQEIAKLLSEVPEEARRSVVAGLQLLADAAGEVPEQDWSAGWAL